LEELHRKMKNNRESVSKTRNKLQVNKLGSTQVTEALPDWVYAGEEGSRHALSSTLRVDV
jgi:hypothetical protein